MSQNDDDGNFDTPPGTPFHTPLHTPRQATSDYSDQVDKQIDLDEQDKINMENRKQQELDRIKQETSQHLSELQPNIPDINTQANDSVRSVFKLAYENARLRGSVPKEQVLVEDESVFKSAYKNARLRGSVRPSGSEKVIVKDEVEK